MTKHVTTLDDARHERVEAEQERRLRELEEKVQAKELSIFELVFGRHSLEEHLIWGDLIQHKDGEGEP